MKRFEVHLVALEPVRGSEIVKTRPCVIVSPDEMNSRLRTLMIAPLTSSQRHWPSRVGCHFAGHAGEIALDQLCSVDKARLVRQLGRIDAKTSDAVLTCLAAMFSP